MFSSVKGKFIFFLTLLMGTTACVLVFFTQRFVADAMSEAQRHSARNVLELVQLNIQGGYKKLLTDKFDMIIGLNQRWKAVAAMCVSGVEKDLKSHLRGGINQKTAQRDALDWIGSIRLPRVELFAFDHAGMVLTHPDPRLEGTSIASLQDIKGRRIIRLMTETGFKENGESAVF